MIKTSFSALALCLALTGAATAGGMADPVMEPVGIETETAAATSSAVDYLPRIIFTLIVLAASGS